MADRLKTVGGSLLYAMGFLALLAIPVLLLVGAAWVAKHLLPWFFIVSTLALAFLIVVVAPLSIFRPCRGFAAMASLLISYVFGATLWMWTLVLTLALWGWWAVVLGLLVAGIGIVPIAMIATSVNGMWSTLGQIAVLLVLVFGTRFYAFWIAERASVGSGRDLRAVPEEVAAALTELRVVGSQFDPSAFELVAHRVQSLILDAPDEFAAMIRRGTPVRRWVWGAVSNAAGDLVESGEFHAYRGVLDPTGPGEQLIRVFDGAVDQMLALGAAEREYIEEQKANLRRNIAQVG